MDVCVALDFNRGDYTFASPSATAAGRGRRPPQGILPEHRDAPAGQPPTGRQARRTDRWRPARWPSSRSISAASSRPRGPRTRAPVPRAGRFADRHRAAPGALDRLRFWCPASRLAALGRRHWLSQSAPSFFWQTTTAGTSVLFAPNPSSSRRTPSPAPTCCSASYPESEHTPAAISARSTLRSWVLLADPDGYSAQLSDQLTRKNCRRAGIWSSRRAWRCGADRAAAAPNDANYGELDGLV
jgi:hypothetical protein